MLTMILRCRVRYHGPSPVPVVRAMSECRPLSSGMLAWMERGTLPIQVRLVRRLGDCEVGAAFAWRDDLKGYVAQDATDRIYAAAVVRARLGSFFVAD